MTSCDVSVTSYARCGLLQRLVTTSSCGREGANGVVGHVWQNPSAKYGRCQCTSAIVFLQCTMDKKSGHKDQSTSLLPSSYTVGEGWHISGGWVVTFPQEGNDGIRCCVPQVEILAGGSDTLRAVGLFFFGKHVSWEGILQWAFRIKRSKQLRAFRSLGINEGMLPSRDQLVCQLFWQVFFVRHVSKLLRRKLLFRPDFSTAAF